MRHEIRARPIREVKLHGKTAWVCQGVGIRNGGDTGEVREPHGHANGMLKVSSRTQARCRRTGEKSSLQHDALRMHRATIGLFAENEIERINQLIWRRTLWERSNSGVDAFP